jgi:DNA processing protein
MDTSRRSLTRSERLDWLRLTRAENVGPITFFRLIERFGTATAALTALPDLAQRGGRNQPLRIPSKVEVEREVAALERLNGRFLAACEPDYPVALAAIDDAPPVLAVRGHAQLLRRPCIGIVGARNASLAGRKMAEKLARDLADAGFTVVSGLARGIDTAAHGGALNGGTAAIMAGGVDVVYPPENRELYEAIVNRGIVLAESPLGIEPQARHFPRRNRLISGLSRGILVVEAALKSGSLITARLALEQGRDVLAVPGSPQDPRAQGCNRLIKEGAQLVETVDDVIEALHRGTPLPMGEQPSLPFATTLRDSAMSDHEIDGAQLERARRQIWECLSPSPVLVDEVVRDCQLSAGLVLTVLLELELAGRIQRHPGSRVSAILGAGNP